MTLSGYDGYDTITPDTGMISGSGDDYYGVIPVSSLSATWRATAETDATDLAITEDGNDTKIAWEVSDDYNPGSNTGVIYVGPLTDSNGSEKTYRVYAGNTSATETEDTDTLWLDFHSVYHMQEDPSGTAPQLVDSTGNNDGMGSNDGTSAGSMTSGDLVSGNFGKAIEFDGSDDEFSLGTSPSFGTAITVIATVALASGTPSGYDSVIGSNNNSAGFHFTIYQGDVSFFLYGPNAGAYATTGGIGDTNWHTVAGRYDGSNVYSYIDGSQQDSTAASGSVASTTAYTLGDVALASRQMTGKIGEVWVSSSAWTADEVATQHNVLIDPTAFWSFGGWTAISEGEDADNALFFGGGP